MVTGFAAKSAALPLKITIETVKAQFAVGSIEPKEWDQPMFLTLSEVDLDGEEEDIWGTILMVLVFICVAMCCAYLCCTQLNFDEKESSSAQSFQMVQAAVPTPEFAGRWIPVHHIQWSDQAEAYDPEQEELWSHDGTAEYKSYDDSGTIIVTQNQGGGQYACKGTSAYTPEELDMQCTMNQDGSRTVCYLDGPDKVTEVWGRDPTVAPPPTYIQSEPLKEDAVEMDAPVMGTPVYSPPTPPANETREPEDLPESGPWQTVEELDSAGAPTGRTYYHNTATDEVTWDRPSGDPADFTASSERACGYEVGQMRACI